MGRLWRRLIAVVVAVVVVGAGAWIVWYWTGKRAYEKCIADLRARGLPVEFADLATDPIPDEENAAMALEEAHRWLEENGEDYSPLDELLVDEAPTEEQRERIEEYLARLGPYFEMLEAAASREGWQAAKAPTALDLGSYLAALQEANRLLEARVRFDASPDGRTERAARNASLHLVLGERIRPDCLLDQLCKQVFQQGAVRILDVARRQERFGAAAFRKLVDDWLAGSIPSSGPPAAPFHGELVNAYWWLHGVLRGEITDLAETLGLSDEAAVLWGELPEIGWLRGHWWGRPRLYRDCVAIASLLDGGASLCDTSPENALRVSREFERADVWPGVLLGAAQVRHYFRCYAEHVAAMRLARVVMALLEHRQETGDWPETLDDIAPRFAHGVPTDPFADGPFAYERTDENVVVRAAVPGRDDVQLEEDLLLWRLEAE